MGDRQKANVGMGVTNLVCILFGPAICKGSTVHVVFKGQCSEGYYTGCNIQKMNTQLTDQTTDNNYLM